MKLRNLLVAISLSLLINTFAVYQEFYSSAEGKSLLASVASVFLIMLPLFYGSSLKGGKRWICVVLLSLGLSMILFSVSCFAVAWKYEIERAPNYDSLRSGLAVAIGIPIFFLGFVVQSIASYLTVIWLKKTEKE